MNKNDFPIFKNHKNLIYFDNAATANKPITVLSAINDFYTKNYSNVHRGNYALSENITEEFESIRSKVAKFINAEPEEIIFTSGTTDSINKIALSLGEIIGGKTIVTTEMEHHSNFLPLQQLSIKNKSSFKIIRVKNNYTLDINELLKVVEDEKPAVAALTHMSNVLGTINPIKEIINSVKSISPNTNVIIDGAQSIPHIQIDVKDIGCDVFAFSGHKIFAPTGIGVLFVKNELLQKIQPTVYGGGMIGKVEKYSSTWADSPTSFEAGTPNIEGVIGLGAAIDYINSIRYKNIIQYEKELTKYFLNIIGGIPGIKIYGPDDITVRGPVFSFSMDKIHPHDISTLLDQHNIATRAGHHCTQILHRDVLKVTATTRASLSIYNEKSEIDELAKALITIQNKFKS